MALNSTSSFPKFPRKICRYTWEADLEAYVVRHGGRHVQCWLSVRDDQILVIFWSKPGSIPFLKANQRCGGRLFQFFLRTWYFVFRIGSFVKKITKDGGAGYIFWDIASVFKQTTPGSWPPPISNCWMRNFLRGRTSLVVAASFGALGWCS